MGRSTGISEFYRSAFWIYGVAALVMHDPISRVVPHLLSAGITNWEVRLELWRCVVLLALMARFFLAAGLYFDEVYVRDTAEGFPRKSYPVDFLACGSQFLLFLPAAVAIASHDRLWGEVSSFSLLVSVILLYDNFWHLVSLGFRFSTSSQIRVSRNHNNLAFAAAAGVYLMARLAAGQDAVFADQAAFLSLLGVTGYDIARLIRKYDTAEARMWTAR